ncbi:rhodanese-like domain-containing protein [Bacillus safensis]|uniref:rhodanese-like domain-containing protein n=1 Tax=Bacillus TaxID=1386 RepID=UPI000750880A|nr:MULTISPECIES: rhodanese-like domain-containing protein [Bacillus]KUR62516.1 sulfurtransferase [Bacillus sp. AM 13(2015)]MCK1974328.1 rhodanese-like domain-containing protein [Bacillus safensis]MCY7733459.1 rhodanese-like domain-containing protein [Bacillus safensis]MEC1116094.1 rhodanese-like domain-containing protein [Bacillus safensis]MED1578329.1 rhodanese-like domain-containing protein [Bacillus safensis]
MIQTLLIIIVIGLLVSRFLPVKGVKQIDAADMKPQLRRQHQQLIDVRSPVEFQTDHIKGFRNIPLPQLKERANQLAKDKEVYVICQSGMRSMQAAKILKKQGFTQIMNIKGGMNAWH